MKPSHGSNNNVSTPAEERAHRLLIKLWTQAQNHADYNKQDWNELQRAINDIAYEVRHG
jgi:hypothetical protein